MTSLKDSLRSSLGTAGILFICASSLTAAQPNKPQDKKTEEKPREETAQTGDLPTMVITATKTETEAWRTASSVTVVDREKIERQQFRLLSDALRDVPGLAIADRGVPGSVATVLMRGTDTEHTALLIDGRPLPANLAGSFNLENQTLDNVERIEVLRGPAASLYGGKTIGGVINIITRSGRGLEKPVTTAFFEAGSYGTFREGLSTLGAAGALDWAFEGSRTDIQGQRINSQYQQNSASGKIGYQISDTLRFDLDTRYYTADVGVAGQAAGFGANDPDNHLLTEFWSISPRLIWETTDWWTQKLTYSYSGFRQVASNFPGGFNPNNRITSHTQFVEWQNEFRPTDKWTITAGAWFQDQKFDRFNDSLGIQDIFHTETNWALYLQSQAEILPGLSLVTGVRYDHYSDFDEATTWRAGLAYRVPVTKTLLHANYGTAFAPPTAQDLAAVFGGNPALLKPERSRGFEFGFEQPIEIAKANVHATYFQNDLRDTYQFPAVFPFLAIPVGKARTRGVELGTDWTPCEQIRIDASYTYLDAQDTDTDARLIRRPRHTLSGGLTVRPVQAVTVSLSANYVMDREDFGVGAFAQSDSEDYLVVRLAANWRVCENLDIFARVENLLGEKYEEVPGFPAYDTGAYAGFRLKF